MGDEWYIRAPDGIGATTVATKCRGCRVESPEGGRDIAGKQEIAGRAWVPQLGS